MCYVVLSEKPGVGYPLRQIEGVFIDEGDAKLFVERWKRLVVGCDDVNLCIEKKPVGRKGARI